MKITMSLPETNFPTIHPVSQRIFVRRAPQLDKRVR
ncbi:hypothetical protein CASFOL_014430 [Castilleja foliolosa]|uniref:Uncharacterized protein n=1 Tax=Castilleja foliolosa TaxID=1961234 RepID=A0ABD3DS00_9LAMI